MEQLQNIVQTCMCSYYLLPLFFGGIVLLLFLVAVLVVCLSCCDCVYALEGTMEVLGCADVVGTERINGLTWRSRVIGWVVPPPRIPVANEGLGWDSLLKM